MINLPVFLADACTKQTVLPDLWRGLRTGGGCQVEVNSIYDIRNLIGNGIEIALTIAAFVAIGFIIYGGIRYTISAGDASNIKKAKETIVNAVVGLIIAMLAFGIVRYITGGFNSGGL